MLAQRGRARATWALVALVVTVFMLTGPFRMLEDAACAAGHEAGAMAHDARGPSAAGPTAPHAPSPDAPGPHGHRAGDCCGPSCACCASLPATAAWSLASAVPVAHRVAAVRPSLRPFHTAPPHRQPPSTGPPTPQLG
jgi:hypothetical protein